MKYLSRIILTLITLIFSSLLCAQSFSNIIVFGDSLSDIGNNTWVDTPGRGAAFAHGAPISNLDPETNLPTIWPQYLAKMNLFSQKNIIKSTAWQHESLGKINIVYAYASAETGKNYVNDQVEPFTYPKNCKTAGLINAQESCVPNLQTQVKTYLANLEQINEKPGKNSLFVLWAGGNDVFDNIARAIYRIGHAKENWRLLLPQQALAYSWFPTVKITTVVNMLIKAGVPANHIYVITLPNISVTPGARTLISSAFPNSLNMQNFALSILSGVTHLFNFDLKIELYFAAWNIKQPFAKPHVVDINRFLEHIITDRDLTGTTFPHVDNSCLAENALPYCKGYLFFNDKHPTTTAGKVLAVYLFNDLMKNSA
jgi:phospholipase/lecithinase/hemolysin